MSDAADGDIVARCCFFTIFESTQRRNKIYCIGYRQLERRGYYANFRDEGMNNNANILIHGLA